MIFTTENAETPVAPASVPVERGSAPHKEVARHTQRAAMIEFATATEDRGTG